MQHGPGHASSIDEGEAFTTLELKINFLKPVWAGKLTATGQVVKNGRTVGLVEYDVHDDQQAGRARVQHLHKAQGRAGPGTLARSERV